MVVEEKFKVLWKVEKEIYMIINPYWHIIEKTFRVVLRICGKFRYLHKVRALGVVLVGGLADGFDEVLQHAARFLPHVLLADVYVAAQPR